MGVVYRKKGKPSAHYGTERLKGEPWSLELLMGPKLKELPDWKGGNPRPLFMLCEDVMNFRSDISPYFVFFQ